MGNAKQLKEIGDIYPTQLIINLHVNMLLTKLSASAATTTALEKASGYYSRTFLSIMDTANSMTIRFEMNFDFGDRLDTQG